MLIADNSVNDIYISVNGIHVSVNDIQASVSNIFAYMKNQHVPKSYSIQLKVRQITVEYGFISVLVTEDLLR